MSKFADRPDAARGKTRTVVCAVLGNGSSPAWEFIERRLNERDRRKLLVVLQVLADLGEVRFNNKYKFKQLEGPIWVVKSYQGNANQVRVFCFRQGNQWVLTHGYIKKKNKAEKRQIARAHQIMQVDLERHKRRQRRRS